MPEAEEPSTAKAPFDNPEGDIILQSADGVNFHVFKLILSLASDVFKSMFTLPHDTKQSNVSSVPVIPLMENSTILQSLLLLCYPAPNPTFETFEDAKAVLEAARKYDIRDAVSSARDIIFARFLETKPLELYALCCIFGWKRHTQVAATKTLQTNLRDFSDVFAGMKDITAFDYHKLLVYHRDCGIAVKKVGESLDWLTSTKEHKSLCMWTCANDKWRSAGEVACKCTTKIHVADFGTLLVTPWFDEYLTSSGKELYTRPCESTIWDSHGRKSCNFAIKKAISCAFCQFRVIDAMELFRTTYAAQVRKVLADVKLEDT